MMNTSAHRLVLALCSAFLLAACGGDTQQTEAPADPHAGHDHGSEHAMEGAHGGEIVEVGDNHLAHLEAVHHEEEGAVEMWLTDVDGNPIEPDEAPALNLVTESGSERVTGVKAEGGWRFTHEALKAEPENARFRLTLKGQVYTPELACGDHEGHDDHEGHEHE